MIKITIPDLPNRTGTEFDRAVKERLETPCPSKLPIHTVQELQALTAKNHTGYLVRCSNGNAGDECLAYCDGFKWVVVALGARISLT